MHRRRWRSSARSWWWWVQRRYRCPNATRGPARPRESGSANRLAVAQRQRRLGLLLAAATAAAWGLETVLTAVAVEGSNTVAVNAVRVPLTAVGTLLAVAGVILVITV